MLVILTKVELIMKKNLLLAFILFLAFTTFAQNPVSIYSAESRRPSQPGAEISKCFDGDINTSYHSKWNVSAMPDTVDFYFYNVKSINQIKYTPRSDAGNGTWQNLEVYHTTVDAPNTFVKDHAITNWAQSAAVKTINYIGTGVVKPFIIRFVITKAVGNFSSCAEMNFYSSETGDLNPNTECDLSASSLSDLKDDKLTPTGATSNNNNSTATTIQKSYDNDFTTIYHSRYSTNKFIVSPSNPAILTYNFSATSMDYLVYYPRTDGSNGNFGEIEVLYKLNGQSTYTSLLNYNAEFKGSPSLISFPTTLNNVISIQIKVKSGYGEFASCAEMMFYKKKPFDVATTGNVFDDALYSTLKAGTIQAQINNISSDFFKNMANCMFNGTYNYRYRVQQYEPYRVVANLASDLKTSTYNQLENPTGIYFEGGTEAVVFVGEQAATYSISLQVADMRVHNSYIRTSYPLKPGVNVISVSNSGLGYIDYYTDNPAATPVTVHIASGTINGCFDVSKDNGQDWLKMINGSAYAQIDIKGKYMNLLFDRNLLKKYNPIDIKPLASVYDTIVKIQFNMMGLGKYNILPKNHMFAYAHNTGGLYAGGLGMHFDYSWGEANYVSVNGILNGDIWGVAHEIGHINQLRPSFRWAGMTEVTNNIYSTYTQYTLGPTKYINARLERENIRPYEEDAALLNTYPAVVGGRYKGFFDKAFIHKVNYAQQNTFARVVPYWQMQLYYQFAGALRGAPTLEQRMSGAAAAPAPGQPDYAYWLGDMMQIQRARNDANLSHGALMLNFVKDVCDVLQEDLTDYFIAIGMLKPINIVIDDYGNKTYNVTQTDINQTIASIKAKNYPLPVSPVLYYLSANSLNTFKDKLLVQGTYGQGLTFGTNTMTIAHSTWKNVVVFETYDSDNTLLEITMVGMRDVNNTQTTLDFPANADKVYAISYDGSKTLVYSKTTLPVTLVSFTAEPTAKGAVLKWNTSSEHNSKAFEIWKSVESTNGSNFYKIGERSANGNKSANSYYTYVDSDFRQSSYYKLVQIDYDGVRTVYDDKIRYVKALNGEQRSVIYPNPATDKLYIKTNAEGEKTDVKILNVLGNPVKQFVVNVSIVTEINIASLPKGVYNIQLSDRQGVQIQKIIKQ